MGEEKNLTENDFRLRKTADGDRPTCNVGGGDDYDDDDDENDDSYR